MNVRIGAPTIAARGRTASGATVMTPTSVASMPSITTAVPPPPLRLPMIAATPTAVSAMPTIARSLAGAFAPGADSRSASIGSTLVARRAGTSAAATVTTVPTTIDTQMVWASPCQM